jgi:hypothetical protein
MGTSNSKKELSLDTNNLDSDSNKYNRIGTQTIQIIIFLDNTQENVNTFNNVKTLLPQEKVFLCHMKTKLKESIEFNKSQLNVAQVFLITSGTYGKQLY